MRYVAAYLLAALGGKDNPSSADIEKILSSVGIEAEGEKLKKVISELNGKNIEELIAAGNFIIQTCILTGMLRLYLMYALQVETFAVEIIKCTISANESLNLLKYFVHFPY